MSESITSFQSVLTDFFELCLHLHKLESRNDRQIQELIAGGNFSYKNLDDINLAFENDFNQCKNRGAALLEQLYFLSEEENFYFFDCTFHVYKQHYKLRKQAFMQKSPDAREIDFIQLELKNLNHPGCKRILEFPAKTMCKACSNLKRTTPDADKLCKLLENGSGILFLNKETVLVNYSRLLPPRAPWQYSNTRKIDFLEKKLKKILTKKTSTPALPETTPDSVLTTNQSILLLDHLGIFASGYFENFTKNKQAEILSKVLGRHTKNIKTAIEKLDKPATSVSKVFERDALKIEQLLKA